jgi:hypothetical protein
MSRQGVLAEGSSLAPNTLFSRTLSDAWILGHRAIRRHLHQQAGRCAACKAAFDPDLEQGGNTNIVVRVHLAAADGTATPRCRLCGNEVR